MDTKECKIAVLIDSDNVPYANIKGMLDEIAKYGTITIKRIYGDWTKPTASGWKSVLLDNALTPIQQYSYTTGKNATDSAMIIDAMDILHSNKVDGFCIVSSDSDFTRLAVRLRESGRLVIGMGEKKTPNPFIVSCDKFIYIEILNQPTQSTSSRVAAPIIKRKEEDVPKSPNSTHSNDASSVPLEILELITQSISDLSNEDGWTFLGKIGGLISKKRPDFDSRNYGFQKLTQLLESFIDKFEIEKRDTSNPHIKHIYVRNKL